MTRITIKNRGYEMIYGNDDYYDLFIEIRDRSFPDGVKVVANKAYREFSENYTREEFAVWMVNIADDYSFKLIAEDILLIK